VGHLFQGRFKAIVVDSDAYLLTLCRYVELNPVRAGWVDAPAAWAWRVAGRMWAQRRHPHGWTHGACTRNCWAAPAGPQATRPARHEDAPYW